MAKADFGGRTIKAAKTAFGANLPLIALCLLVFWGFYGLQMNLAIRALENPQAFAPPEAGAQSGVFVRANRMREGELAFALLRGFSSLALSAAVIFCVQKTILKTLPGGSGGGLRSLTQDLGGFGWFLWRSLTMVFRILLFVLPLALALPWAISRIRIGPEGFWILGLLSMLLLIGVFLVLSMRYGPVLPAAVAGDADQSLAAAAARSKGRVGDMVFVAVAAALLSSGLVWLVQQFGIAWIPELQPPSREALLEDPYRALADQARSLRAAPAFWFMLCVQLLINLTMMLFGASILAVAYRDAAEEGLAQPGARLSRDFARNALSTKPEEAP